MLVNLKTSFNLSANGTPACLLRLELTEYSTCDRHFERETFFCVCPKISECDGIRYDHVTRTSAPESRSHVHYVDQQRKSARRQLFSLLTDTGKWGKGLYGRFPPLALPAPSPQFSASTSDSKSQRNVSRAPGASLSNAKLSAGLPGQVRTRFSRSMIRPDRVGGLYIKPSSCGRSVG